MATFLEVRDGGLRFQSRSQTAKADTDVYCFKVKPGLSKSTARVYRAAWIQLVSYAVFHNFEPLKITHAQLAEFLATPGPMQRERICAVRAVFAAHGLPMPVAPVDISAVAARIGTLVIGLMPDPVVSTLAAATDEELLDIVRASVAKKKRAAKNG